MRVVAVIQARAGSSRLPGKVLLPLAILNIVLTAFFRLVGNGQVF